MPTLLKYPIRNDPHILLVCCKLILFCMLHYPVTTIVILSMLALAVGFLFWLQVRPGVKARSDSAIGNPEVEFADLRRDARRSFP